MSSPHGCLCVTVAVLGPVLLYNPNPLQADSDNIDFISSFFFFFTGDSNRAEKQGDRQGETGERGTNRRE